MTIDKKQLASLTKKERRELQREMTRIKREADRKKRKRRKVLGISGLVLLIVALIAAVALIVWTNLRIAGEGPKNMASDGIVLTSDGQTISAIPTDPRPWGQRGEAAPAPKEGVVPITIYVDYGSKDAAIFDTTNAQQLQQWLTYGFVQLEIKPIALDQYDEATDGYSSIAANAAACVANFAPTSFLAVNTALLDANPLVTDTDIDKAGVLKEVNTAMGAEDPDVTQCINDDRYATWVSDVSQDAANGPLPGTKVKKVAHAPLVLIDGKQFTGDYTKPTELMAFISQILTAEEQSEGKDESGDEGKADEKDDAKTSTETPAPEETEKSK